jgi:hypothetical protein
MLVGTVFTLLVVPSIYMLVARKRRAALEVVSPDHEPALEVSSL